MAFLVAAAASVLLGTLGVMRPGGFTLLRALNHPFILGSIAAVLAAVGLTRLTAQLGSGCGGCCSVLG